MTTAEIKNDLHRLVVETDDLEILEQILALFNSLKEEDQDAAMISDDEMTSVQKGLDDLKNARTVSREQVKMHAQEILRQSN